MSVGWLAGCAADRVASHPSSVGQTTIAPGETTIRVLQMNLCNSGRASCYTGRAVSTAAAVISHTRPHMVSLNEVCRDDMDVLERAMSAITHGAAVASAFMPAQDRHAKAPVRCQNGQEFGDGVLALRPSAARGSSSSRGVYPIQDPGDAEERVWVCIDLGRQYSGCTTHTASTNPAIALAQCRYLLSSTVPALRRHDGGEVILAGDLNLAVDGSPNPQSCFPRGYQHADDGALQYVVASPGIAIQSHSVIDMGGATDHPGLLVDLVLSRR